MDYDLRPWWENWKPDSRLSDEVNERDRVAAQQAHRDDKVMSWIMGAVSLTLWLFGWLFGIFMVVKLVKLFWYF